MSLCPRPKCQEHSTATTHSPSLSRRATPPLLDPSPHEFPPVVVLREQLVVSAAQHANVLHGRRPATPVRPFVMQFEKPALLAASAVRARKRAPHPVARDHRSPNIVRNVPRSFLRFHNPHYRRPRRSRPERKALLQAICNEQIERALQHDREVTVGRLVPEKVLRLLELVVKTLVCRELDLVSSCAERGDGH